MIQVQLEECQEGHFLAHALVDRRTVLLGRITRLAEGGFHAVADALTDPASEKFHTLTPAVRFLVTEAGLGGWAVSWEFQEPDG